MHEPARSSAPWRPTGTASSRWTRGLDRPGFPEIQLEPRRLDRDRGEDRSRRDPGGRERVRSDDARTWATVDEAGKIELKELGSDRVLQQAQLPPGQLPFDLQYHGGTSRSCPSIASSARPDSFGSRCGASTRGSDGEVVDEEPVLAANRDRRGGSPARHREGRRLGRGLRHPRRLVDDDVRKAFVDGHRQLVQQRWQADRLGERRRPGHRGTPKAASRYTSSRAHGQDLRAGLQSGRTNAVHRRARRCDDCLGSRRLATPRAVVPTPSPGSPGERAEFFQDEGPAIAATSPDGRRLAVLEGGTAVAVHDLETGKRPLRRPITGRRWSRLRGARRQGIATGEHTGLTAWSATNGAKVRPTRVRRRRSLPT